jgi:hypothetical protein
MQVFSRCILFLASSFACDFDVLIVYILILLRESVTFAGQLQISEGERLCIVWKASP